MRELKELEKVKVTTEKTIVEYSNPSNFGEQESEKKNKRDCSISTESKKCTPDKSAPALNQCQQMENFSDEESSLNSHGNDELIAMAMNPNTSESHWMRACSELNRRNVTYNCKRNSGSNKSQETPSSRRLMFTATIVVLAIASGLFVFWQTDGKKEMSGPVVQVIPSKEIKSKNFWNLSTAHGRTKDIQVKLGIKVANAIETRGWTEREAAENLGVDPKLIGLLLRGKADAIAIDKAMEMLLALDKNIDLSNLSSPLTAQDRQAAVHYYTKVLISYPENTNVYLERALEYRIVDQYELALADYSSCLELDPNNTWALNDRAGVYCRLGKYEASLRDSNQLIKLLPKQDFGYMRRGLVYQETGDYAGAINDYSKVIQIGSSPTVTAPYLRRAESYEKQGNLKAAIADYERALAINPTAVRQERIDSLKKRLFTTTTP